MKITAVEARALSHAYATPPARLAVGAPYKRDMVLVRVTTDDGLVGYGESHHATSPTSVAEVVNTTLAPIVVGQDAFDTEGIWHRIYRRQLQSHSMGHGVAIAMSGLDIALWDIKGKALGQPVYALLGGGRRSFRAYAGGAHLGFQDPASLVDEVARLQDMHGFTAVKLKIGDTVSRDLERVRAVRDAFGSDLLIMVDVNTAYDYVDLLRLLPGLEELQVAWLEEPFPKDEALALGELRARARIPIAAGENLHGRQDFRRVLAVRGIDILQPDVSKAGGITETKKIGDIATMEHLRFAPHTSHSHLNYAATLHVMSSVPVSYVWEADPSENRFAEVVRSPVQVRGGEVSAPDGPGLGVDVDEENLGRFAGMPGPAFRY